MKVFIFVALFAVVFAGVVKRQAEGDAEDLPPDVVDFEDVVEEEEEQLPVFDFYCEEGQNGNYTRNLCRLETPSCQYVEQSDNDGTVTLRTKRCKQRAACENMQLNDNPSQCVEDQNGASTCTFCCYTSDCNAEQ